MRTAQSFCAAYVIVRHEGKYLFVKRAHTTWMNGYYGLPAGKVEVGEGFLPAAIREAKEEVGITIFPAGIKHAVTLWRLAEDTGLEWCDVAFDVSSWKGEPYNAEPDVHSEIAWFGMRELPDNVIPSVRRMLELHEAGETYGEYRGVDALPHANRGI